MAISVPFHKVPDAATFESEGESWVKVLEESLNYNAIKLSDSAIGCKFTDEWPVIMLNDEFEDYLPDWAEQHNKQRRLQVGAQLQTRDGRVTGNGRIYKVSPSEYIGDMICYSVMTDAGNSLVLTDEEVHSMFYVGPYIIKEVSPAG